MGKKYDAQKMTNLCDTLSHAVGRYITQAEMLENEYSAYNSNNTYRGEAANASKEFVYKGQGRITREQIRVLTRLNKKFKETNDAFSSMVDYSPNAKIDTDVLEKNKRFFVTQSESFEQRAMQAEQLSREIRDKFERFGYITTVSYDRARYGFEDLCGYSGFMNKCIRTFEEFDEGAKAHLKSTGLAEYMNDLENDTKATIIALDSMTVYNPDVKKIAVTPIAHMAMRMVGTVNVSSLPFLKCNVEVANRTREIFLKLCRNIEIGLRNIRDPLGNVKSNDDFILSFGMIEANKSSVVQIIIRSKFYKEYKDIVKNNLIDVRRSANIVLDTVNKATDKLSDIGQGLDGILKRGSHKIIDGQSDNIWLYRLNTGGFIGVFEVGGAIQSYIQTGTFDDAQKNAIENYKSFQKGGTDCIIDMVTGLFSFPKMVLNDSQNSRAAGTIAEYICKNGISNIPEDITKFCNEAKETVKSIGSSVEQRASDMEVKDWYQAAGYITVFGLSLLAGGEATSGSKVGEASETAEGITKVEKITGFADDAARITAGGADDATRIASHADDVAALEKIGEAENISTLSKGTVIEINNPVLDNIRTGSALKGDPLHAFNDIIDNYAGEASKFSLTGGDGVERTLYQIEGSLNGKQGVFEWIVDPNPARGVTHRRFIEGVKITGRPNARP